MKTKEIKLSIEEWIAVPDNPQQRNTEQHAKKALKYHMSEASPTQQRVALAEMPNGKQFKLDGHTRCHLWEQELLEAPQYVKCDVYYVKNKKEAVELYEHFDTSTAAETAGDKLSGAFRYYGIPKTSKLWTTAGVTTAVKTIYSQHQRGMRHVDVKKCIAPFVKELKIIDRGEDFSHKFFPAPVFCAMLMTIHLDGEEALSFWEGYVQDSGRKNPKSMDAVYCIRDEIRRYRDEDLFTRGSRRAVVECVPRMLAIYEKWEDGLFKNVPKPEGDFKYYVLKYCGDIIKKLDWKAEMNNLELPLVS